MKRSRAWAVTTTVLATAVVGCQAPPKPVPPPPPPPPAMTVPQQRAADADQYRNALARFDAPLAELPGHTQADHRRLAAAALSALTDALRLAYGTDPSPSFANHVAVVDAAAHAVAVDDVPRSRMEAAENQALHAAVAAAAEVATRVLFDDAELPPLVSAAGDRADAARVTQGPLHDGDVTDALRSLDVALHRVGDDLHDRFTPSAAPLPAAATPPPVAATSVPSTEPSAMPSSMPTTMP